MDPDSIALPGHVGTGYGIRFQTVWSVHSTRIPEATGIPHCRNTDFIDVEKLQSGMERFLGFLGDKTMLLHRLYRLFTSYMSALYAYVITVRCILGKSDLWIFDQQVQR